MSRLRAAWLGYWALMRRYLRYEVDGLEHLEDGPARLIVGYHGRPIAWDVCLLALELYERRGVMPCAIAHGAFDAPGFSAIRDAVGMVTGDGPSIAAALDRGRHVIVTPGGTREGCRSSFVRYRVDWGERIGYLRLALRHGLEIVPVAASGVDQTYLAPWNGYRMGKRLRAPLRLPVWLGLGPLGVWPWSPPFPVKVRQKVGEPIVLGDVDPDDRPTLLRLHERVTTATQGLLDGLG